MRSSYHNIIVALLVSLAPASSAFSAVTHKGKAVAAVTVVTESDTTLIRSTSFQNLPGATAKITIPAGMVQLVQAEFSAESLCSEGGFPENWCSLRILADGVEMSPAAHADKDFAFDAVGQSEDYWEGHAMQRSIVLGPGTHTIKVQAAVTLSGVDFFLDDWSFTVTQYNNGN